MESGSNKMVYPQGRPTMLRKISVHCGDRSFEGNFLQKNGYPHWFFDEVLRDFTKTIEPAVGSTQVTEVAGNEESQSHVQASGVDPASDSVEKPSFRHFLKVPYIGRPSILFSKRVRKVFKTITDEKLRITYSTSKVHDFFRVKDQDPKELLTNVVYRFTCLSDSNIKYIGYSNRSLRERVKEHLAGGTRISDHIGTCQSCSRKSITSEDFAILKKCRRKNDTAIFEALLIKKYNPSLNIQLVKPGYSHQLRIFN